MQALTVLLKAGEQSGIGYQGGRGVCAMTPVEARILARRYGRVPVERACQQESFRQRVLAAVAMERGDASA